MLTEQHKFTSFETEFRQSLRRGYTRLLIAQSQELDLDPAELMLELLGDYQVLDFQCSHSGHGARFNLPFVYLVPWRSDVKNPVSLQLADKMMMQLVDPNTTYSPYRRMSTQE